MYFGRYSAPTTETGTQTVRRSSEICTTTRWKLIRIGEFYRGKSALSTFGKWDSWLDC